MKDQKEMPKVNALTGPASVVEYPVMDPIDSGSGAAVADIAPEYCAWEVPGKPVTVQIDFDVVDRLLREVQRGFGLVPRRGVELGGILLGTCEPSRGRPGEWLVRIVDFEGVPCSHSKGLAYQLTAEELARFDEVLARWRRAAGRQACAVGYYRSHTREGLSLAEEDVELFNRCFQEPGSVALLVKPYATRVSVGAVFIRENGHLRTESSYLEFPFRRADLGGGDSGATAEQTASPAANSVDEEHVSAPSMEPHTDTWFGKPSATASGRVEPPPTPSALEDQVPFGIPGARRDPATGKRFKTGWVWLPLSFVFLLLGVVLGFQVAVSLRGSGVRAGQDPFALGLTVAAAGEGVDVRWDRSALAIQGAARGALTITDAGMVRVVELDAPQLQMGSVSYRRAFSDVQFKLEVFARERTSVSESASFRASPSR